MTEREEVIAMALEVKLLAERARDLANQAVCYVAPRPPQIKPKKKPEKQKLELPEPMSTGQCVVYFVSCGEFVKIGTSRKAISRLAGLRTSSPYRLDILATLSFQDGRSAAIAERVYHDRFSILRERGEWFRYDGELRDYVEGLRAGRTE